METAIAYAEREAPPGFRSPSETHGDAIPERANPELAGRAGSSNLNSLIVRVREPRGEGENHLGFGR